MNVCFEVSNGQRINAELWEHYLSVTAFLLLFTLHYIEMKFTPQNSYLAFFSITEASREIIS